MLVFGSVPSLKLTEPLKIGLPNRKVVFQPSIFRGYVSFREGKFNSLHHPPPASGTQQGRALRRAEQLRWAEAADGVCGGGGRCGRRSSGFPGGLGWSWLGQGVFKSLGILAHLVRGSPLHHRNETQVVFRFHETILSFGEPGIIGNKANPFHMTDPWEFCIFTCMNGSWYPNKLSGQIITTVHRRLVTLNGGLVRGYSQNIRRIQY